jgi:hypothetical protein
MKTLILYRQKKSEKLCHFVFSEKKEMIITACAFDQNIATEFEFQQLACYLLESFIKVEHMDAICVEKYILYLQ